MHSFNHLVEAWREIRAALVAAGYDFVLAHGKQRIYARIGA